LKYKQFAATWTGLHGTNRFLKGVCLALLAINAVFLVAWLKKDRVVVLVPPTLDERAAVSRNAASQGYKKAWALFAAQMLGNVTPDNADFVLKAFSDMVGGEIRQAMAERVAGELETLKLEKVSSVFEVRTLIYEPETDKVFVTGRSNMVGPGGKTANSQQTFEFKIDVRQYAPLITRFAVYPGGPMTAPLVQREKDKQQQKQLEDSRRQAAPAAPPADEQTEQ
jgi:conjugal transfer pilus assembly protein TraE